MKTLKIIYLILIVVSVCNCEKNKNEQNKTITQYPITFNPNLTYDSITDIDDNVYKTITIGTQTWMAENLKATKFNDGSPIPNVIEKSAWTVLTSPAYSWYDNDAKNYKDTYGALYNWYALSATTNGNKNVCPAGWHVPSDTEFLIMINYLGGRDIAGGKLKETDTIHWQSPNTGADNSSGFTALPGGCYFDNSRFPFEVIGQCGNWWTTSETRTEYASNICLKYNTIGEQFYYDFFKKSVGFSVRCVKD